LATDLQAIANHGCLYHRLTRFYAASPLNPIFMLGGAPEAYEVSSKTPRVQLVFLGNFGAEAFPIKASDKPEVNVIKAWTLTT